jgi:hypothetical protein
MCNPELTGEILCGIKDAGSDDSDFSGFLGQAPSFYQSGFKCRRIADVAGKQI